LDFLNSSDVPETEKVDEKENCACHVKEMLCDIDDISGEYKRETVILENIGEVS